MFVFVGCNNFYRNDKISFIDDFPETTALSGSRIKEIDNINFFASGWVAVVDSFLIVLSTSNSGSIFVYSTKDYRQLGVFSIKGRGPGEYINPIGIRPDFNTHDKAIYVVDPTNFSLTLVDILESVKKASYVYEEEDLTFLPDAWDIKECFYYCNGQMVYTSAENRFSIFNRKTKDWVRVPYNYPKPGFPVNKSDAPILNSSVLAVNADLRKVASAPQYMGQLDFYSFEGVHLSTSVYCDYNLLKKSLTDVYLNRSVDVRAFAHDILCDDRFVYVLDVNMTIEESMAVPTALSKILIFDWDGNPVKEFVLDRPVARFAIDFPQKKIYALCPYESDFPLVVYDISNL